jgi:hydrogenase maturation protease
MLLLGVGNLLLSDDGAGVHVIRSLEALQRRGALPQSVRLYDGGTIGLSLLAQLQETDAFVAVDAMQMGAEPGTVRTFRGVEMDRQLGGTKRSAHEVALSDLIGAAHLSGCAPERRALVAIQPASTEWGLSPTEAVSAAIPVACQSVISIIEDWAHDSR